jgi:4-aminobutyrate aminotransferase-like enzyme
METENLAAQAAEKGDYAMHRLRVLEKDNSLIGDVRGRV